MRHILPIVLAAIPLWAAWYLNLPREYGAHPWWSQQSVQIGAPIGLVIAALAAFVPIRALIRGAVFAALAIASYYIAYYGKTQFAASYADDTFAGQLWYFGWIAVSAGIAATLVSLGQSLFSRRKPA